LAARTTSDEATAKVREAEEAVRKQDFAQAATSYRLAATLEEATSSMGQASLYDAYSDFFQARSYLQKKDTEIAINFCNNAIDKFKKLSQPLWEAKSKSLLYDAKAIGLLAQNQFEEMQKLFGEAKTLLGEIRKTYPDQDKELEADILDLQEEIHYYELQRRAARGEFQSAATAMSDAINVNSDRFRVLENVQSVSATVCKITGEIMRARRAQTLGEDNLEKWYEREAKRGFEDARTFLSLAESLINNFVGQKPNAMTRQKEIIKGNRLMNEGLGKLVEATDKSVACKLDEARKVFTEAATTFRSADGIFTDAGKKSEDLPLRARRYAEIAEAKASALKLSWSRYALAAGQQAAVFTLLTLFVLSILSLRVVQLSSEQLVYGSIFVGLVFGFGLDAVRFKDILPWSSNSQQKSK